MQTLNSILTLSTDFDYGELVRMNYDLRPVETSFLPFLAEAGSVVQAIMPDAVLLHLKSEDLVDAMSFLKQLVEVQQQNPNYAPRLFVSTDTYTILQHKLANQHRLSLLTEGPLEQEMFITCEEFSLEILIELFDMILLSTEECEHYSFGSFLSTINPFDSMVPALAY